MEGHLENGLENGFEKSHENGLENPVENSPFTSYVESYNPATSPQHVSPLTSDLDCILQTKNQTKIKKFVRSGNWSVADGVRRVLWWKLCCSMHKETGSNSIYDETVKELFGKRTSEHHTTLPAFVDLVFKEHYHISESGIDVAKRVICVLDATCPDITYSPLVFPMCCLFLHYMSEADCYNCLYGLVRDNFGYIAQTKKAHKVMKYALQDLSNKYAKSFCLFILKRGLQLEFVLDNWLWWIYRDLPFTHLVRVIDCYLVEGPKMLYRVAIAILILFYKHKVRTNPDKIGGDLDRAISQFCEDMPAIPPEKLLKAAFGIQRFSRKLIHKHEVKAEMFVNSLRHAPPQQSLLKSKSSDSLNLKVSRSFSDTIDSSIVKGLQGARPRSNSQALQVISVITNKCKSDLLQSTDFQTIWSWLPVRVTLNEPVLLYTTAEHGTSLATFYARVENTEPTLLLIKTSKSEVFGAYCTSDWLERHDNPKKYFGTGESFVFTLSPNKKQYSWVGLKLQEDTPSMACLFMNGDAKSISIGGGNGVAISLDGDLFMGRSQVCDTFGNPPLADGEDFECVAIEVFGFK